MAWSTTVVIPPDGNMTAESRSSPLEIQNYLGRISGPLLDRLDLHVEVPPVKFREMDSQSGGETSAGIRERVLEARRAHYRRRRGQPVRPREAGRRHPGNRPATRK